MKFPTRVQTKLQSPDDRRRTRRDISRLGEPESHSSLRPSGDPTNVTGSAQRALITLNNGGRSGGYRVGTSWDILAPRTSEECGWHCFHSLLSELKAEGVAGGETVKVVNKDAM